MERRWLTSGRKPAMMTALYVLVLVLLTPASAEAFGTIDGLGQRREHERITRAALACPAGIPSTGDCFEPKSIDQVAGKAGTFGAVGVPDSDEVFNAAAHCDDADFLSGPYPRTRAQATDALLNCVRHLRNRFNAGVNTAADLLDTEGLAKLAPRTLAIMHGASYTGDAAAMLECLPQPTSSGSTT